jgi:hypothetical protein
MAMEEFLTSPTPELALLAGGLLAIIIGVVGNSDKTHIDEVAVVLAFIVGISMVALAIMEVVYGSLPTSTVLILGILGFSLFSRGFKKIKWAFIISVLIAGGIGLLLNYLATTYSIGFMSGTVIIVICVVIFFILFLLLKAIETITRFLGAVISFRPIILVGGLLAIVEAVLLFMGSSISGLLS